MNDGDKTSQQPPTELARLHQHVAEAEQAKARREESGRGFEFPFDLVSDALIVIGPEGRIADANRAACELLGYSKAELLELSIERIHPSGEMEKVGRAIERALRDGTGDLAETDLINKEGKTVPVEGRGSAIQIAGQVHFMGSFRDISERHLLERQLRQAQKLEAVGRLAGGIAHDFNNLLMVINGETELLLSTLDPTDPRREGLKAVAEAGGRAADLTRQLLAFSRRQAVEMRVLDLNHLLENMGKMLRRLIGEDITLIMNLAEDLGSVKADRGQIEQVVVNLVVNARDAMPTGGVLMLETSNVDVDREQVSRQPEADPGPHVLLRVSDTGVGMTSEVKEHLFEPFFTTKEQGKGTGLGLATVCGIVKQSGGHIQVSGELGEGTTVELYLPRLDAKQQEEGASASGNALLRGIETILVVEDQHQVRGLAVRMLRQLGYAVLEAPHGVDALYLLKVHEGPIHLVLTDAVMPHTDGKEFLEQLRQARPDVKVVYMSAHLDQAIARYGLDDVEVPFLRKPFAVEELASTIRKVLDEDAS